VHHEHGIWRDSADIDGGERPEDQPNPANEADERDDNCPQAARRDIGRLRSLGTSGLTGARVGENVFAVEAR
jgi:hypothetical protein